MYELFYNSTLSSPCDNKKTAYPTIMTDKRDQLYRDTDRLSQSVSNVGSFKFDQRVAEVFNDMISRSVPGYQQILEMLPTLVKQFRSESPQNYYDLGCSLGAGMLAMAQGLTESQYQQNQIIGIDNSSAMLSQAKQNLASFSQQTFKLEQQDLQQTKIVDAAMVLMNFTLQFIPLNERDEVVANIYSGLVKGGALILSEKISCADSATQKLMTDIHHQYKADQGYSELEIAKKRDAIENVLIPESLETHVSRLKSAGFQIITPWVRNLQFISILAVK